jgi:excisionase family DNA binding protein
MADNILTRDEVAKKLKVSQSWVYKKVAARIIPHFNLGGTLRFSEKEIDNWLQLHRSPGRQKV